MQSELRSTTARLERARRTIDASERLLAGGRVEGRRHERDLRPLPNLHRCLINATNRLIRGQRAISHTVARILPFPQHATSASAALYEAQTQLFLRLRETGLLILRLEDLAAATRNPSGPLARFSLLLPAGEAGTDTATTRRGSDDATAETRSYPPYRCLLRNPASAARRVSRGRAPPALSFRSL